MNYSVIPLIYGANEHFKNTIRFAVEFIEEIDVNALRQYKIIDHEQTGIRSKAASVKVQFKTAIAFPFLMVCF